jgi:hypothetical protein
MDARCELLREFGATSYEDIEQCDKLLKTLKEGIEEGKMYEAQLPRGMAEHLVIWQPTLKCTDYHQGEE